MLTFKYFKIPLILTVALGLIPHIAKWFYWDSGLYDGPRDVLEPSLEFAEVPGLLLVLFIAIFLKYFIFDLVGRKLAAGKHRPTLILEAVYVIAAAIDAVCLWVASQPLADSGFVGAFVVLLTPLVLIGGLVAIAIARTKAPKKPARKAPVKFTKSTAGRKKPASKKSKKK